MGMPIARNLLKAGHQLTVWNRTREKAEELERGGAQVAEKPEEACDNEVLFTMLADDAVLEEVIFGIPHLTAAFPDDAIHVSLSTISVALSRKLVEVHEKAGQKYVAAPVFGRPDAAAAAKLFVVAAGPSAAVSKCQPLFDVIGQKTFLIGEDAPASNVVKLGGNFMLGCVLETLAEAFAFVRKYGVDPHKYLEVITGTLFSAPVYKTYGGIMVEGKFQPAGFTVPLGLKDVRLVLAAADEAGVPMRLANVTRDRFLTAISNGYEDCDWAVVARLSAEDAGLES
jgi:3-hydroxyisobutyrate dehydrogenase-like beta-hydroxyacid dehydrogenase